MEYRYYDRSKKPILKAMELLSQGIAPFPMEPASPAEQEFQAKANAQLLEQARELRQNPPTKDPALLQHFELFSQDALYFAKATGTNLTITEGPMYGTIQLETAWLTLTPSTLGGLPDSALTLLSRLLLGADLVTFDAQHASIDEPASFVFSFRLVRP